MALLRTVDDGSSKPLSVHGRDHGKEELLLWLPVAFAAPGVRHVSLEFWDVLDLVPHLCDGELRPLWDLHRRYLVGPEDILGARGDLVEEADRAVLLIWKVDVLYKGKGE